MSDQRNRVTTDPGLGPIEPEHPSTLRSMAAASPIPGAEESIGAPVYYEPKPLNAVSDHKTLELETVKLSENIDPRKLPTELKLRRPVLHVLPASDPNWPAPVPQFDSGWPPPETVLTTSQPPQVPRRRSFIPLALLLLLGASVLLLLGARARRHSAASGATQIVAPESLARVSPKKVGPLPSAPPAGLSRGSTPVASPSASSAQAATGAVLPANATEAAANALPARSADGPHHTISKLNVPSIANGPAPSAPPGAKPKRAIY